MSNRAKRRQHRPSAQNPSAKDHRNPKVQAFTPVPVRTRMDGWTPDRQVAFVTALAATACIEDACGAVGMSPRSYYDLRARPGSDSFRQAVEAALDVGTHRLETALMARAIHGEATPVFYKGEQVGERRRYDNKLGLTLLRARAADRYGAWRDRVQQVREHPDGAALILQEATRRLAEDGKADMAGRARPRRDPLRSMILDRTDHAGLDRADPDHAGPPEDYGPTLMSVLADHHGFDRAPDEGQVEGRAGDEDRENAPEENCADEDWTDENWTDEDWAREEAYAEELAAQTADPGGVARAPSVRSLYTSGADGG